jgi:hypothetical protein
MLKLNDNKLRVNTLSAILVKDKINNENKRVNEIISQTNKSYWLLDSSDFDPIAFSECVTCYYENKHNEININLDSFLKLISPKYHQQVINAFFSAHELFNNKISYKTKHDNRSIDNFIIDEKLNKQLIHNAMVLVETET